MSSEVDVKMTFGPLMMGGLFAAIFSGVVITQSFIYYKMYPKDRIGVKFLVAVVLFLDVGHTTFVFIALWDQIIAHFGDPHRIDFVPWSLALTIAFTAVLTFLVHLFFIYRIYKLSVRQWITIPLTAVAVARLAFASLTTAKLITYRSLTDFVREFHWSFTCGLALSAALDIVITILLCSMLFNNRSREKASRMNDVLDSLILYTFESGALTSAVATASLACWLNSHQNLVFMGLHFIIAKSYANSLLATLNTRKNLREPRNPTPSEFWERSIAMKFTSALGFPRHHHHHREPRVPSSEDLKEWRDQGTESMAPNELATTSAIPLDRKSSEHSPKPLQEP